MNITATKITWEGKERVPKVKYKLDKQTFVLEDPKQSVRQKKYNRSLPISQKSSAKARLFKFKVLV